LTYIKPSSNRTNYLKDDEGSDVILKDQKEFISNVCGGITDEEFSDEIINPPQPVGKDGGKFQLNFLGADLEKINSARNIKDEINRNGNKNQEENRGNV